MGLLSTIMDVVLNRPRGITGKGVPRGERKEGQFGPMDAPAEPGAQPSEAVRDDPTPDARAGLDS